MLETLEEKQLSKINDYNCPQFVRIKSYLFDQ